MRQFELHRTYRGKKITAQVLQFDRGVHISLYGGDLPHIGAVGVIDPDGNCSVTQFPGHREGVVCERWLDALAAEDVKPAVVEAGIHYNNLKQDGIDNILFLTDRLLKEIILNLQKNGVQ